MCRGKRIENNNCNRASTARDTRGGFAGKAATALIMGAPLRQSRAALALALALALGSPPADCREEEACSPAALGHADQDREAEPVPDAIAPAHTRGEIEPPAGEKDMGGSIAGVYTTEQQLR